MQYDAEKKSNTIRMNKRINWKFSSRNHYNDDYDDDDDDDDDGKYLLAFPLKKTH